VVVLLGTPTAESSELYALTVTEGDPSWAGPLAGTALNLPVYHILEPAVRAVVPAETYEAEVGIAQYSLDAEAIEGAVRGVRERVG
jgi:glycine/sarcosine/betaine reductase complex component A